MSKKLKLKIATKRLKRSKNKMINKLKSDITQKPSFWARVRTIAMWPLRALWRGMKNIWKWVRSIDLIGLVNLTLLSAIIVLFSMLIIDITKYKQPTVVLIAAQEATVIPVRTIMPVQKTVPAEVRKTVTIIQKQTSITYTNKLDVITLPLNKNINKSTKSDTIKCAPVQKLYGDVIIDGNLPGKKLGHRTNIYGNLYLQNMYKYTLPCGTRIEGDLLLRNVGMLKFCDDFVITGNIYVSRNSSFGPIPPTARLGGQVIF